MFITSIFSHTLKEQKHDLIDKPFGSEIFAMMAASTFGLAYGGPDRMVIEQPNPQTAVMAATTVSTAAGRVKGWYIYDPSTEHFRQSSVDEQNEAEQVAAQALVDVCEQALIVDPATKCGCEREEDLSLMRSSFSFVVNNESFEDTPAASPLSDGYGMSELKAATMTTYDTYDYEGRKETNSESAVLSNGGVYKASSSSSHSDNSQPATSSLTFFPRLSSHRGSVMETGVVLDTRVFGGIGIVQEGRKVGVRRNEGCVRLRAAESGRV